jgi:hypothetical protein
VEQQSQSQNANSNGRLLFADGRVVFFNFWKGAKGESGLKILLT